MADDEDIFLKIIERLTEGGVLTDIVLIGSWVLPIYRACFNDAPEIPILRTTNVDFLVGMPLGFLKYSCRNRTKVFGCVATPLCGPGCAWYLRCMNRDRALQDRKSVV